MLTELILFRMEPVAGPCDEISNSIKFVHNRFSRINIFHKVRSKWNMWFPRTYYGNGVEGCVWILGKYTTAQIWGQVGEVTCNWTTTCETEKMRLFGQFKVKIIRTTLNWFVYRHCFGQETLMYKVTWRSWP